MSKTKYWYSEIYKIEKYGFFVEEKENQRFLTYRYKNGKEISVKIKSDTFNVLKKEWS